MNETINFESRIPYYIQLMDILKEKVQLGNWNPGDQILGEQDLCELYGVSRTVVRQALRELELEGVVNRRKGKGTFISLPKISEGLAQKLTGFYQDMVERGLKPVTKVLHQNITPSKCRSFERKGGSFSQHQSRRKSCRHSALEVYQ